MLKLKAFVALQTSFNKGFHIESSVSKEDKLRRCSCAKNKFYGLSLSQSASDFQWRGAAVSRQKVLIW